ncbi:AMP-binding protein [Aquibium sp. A9E412]|uniref:class I adenylate-forming enzyme family protein n=1 Tax=Aquibium sp. A9E412 TaxID=2976767 RepID=UPI0025B1A1AE|nr:AMP-binding protein [Aquibium sp. A9E412]MDN2566714.1 AMP-binding protein [Aquibium sp. A9E412]
MKIIAGDELTWAARQFAGRVALQFGERHYGYGELEAQSNRLANALMALGLEPGARVAVLLNNCIESVETVFGVTKAALTYVALNARHTVAEHADILRDAGATLVIAGPEFQEVAEAAVRRAPSVRHLVGLGWRAPGAASYAELLDSVSPAPPRVAVDDAQITRIVYTSGTTGKPKGIAYSHARARHRLDNFFAALEYRLGVEDSMIHVGPLTHAAGNYMIPYYLRGARNIILPRFDPQLLQQTIERERVTHLLLVPTMIVRLLDDIAEHGMRHDLSSLTCINYGTASTPVHVLRRAIETFGPVFRQHLGMSECPQPLTILYPHEHVLDGAPHEVRRLASCGRPTMNVSISIRGRDDAPLPPGETGEIAVEARGVAAVEYWNRPDLLAETVREGWFYTGDVGWQDEDGFLYIVGRNKDMIISGGFNVYAREVEDALLQNPELADAAVIGAPDAEWGEVIVAAVVARPGRRPTPESVIDACRDHIAGYKKPRRIVFVEALPRNVAGKVNKAELKAALLEGAAGHGAPS